MYTEEDQRIKEDKVLAHEIDLHSKNVTKHILQEQVRQKLDHCGLKPILIHSTTKHTKTND